MAVSVRDVSGTPILPVIEHFGGSTAEEEAEQGEAEEGEGKAASRRSRRAAGFPPATASSAATPEGERATRKQEQQEKTDLQLGRRQGGGIGRTFLDRSPPPECVEAVLHKGCTARKFSAVAACLIALVRHRGAGDRRGVVLRR